MLAAAAAVVLAAVIGGWRLLGFSASGPPDTVVMTDNAIVATSADGSVKWRHEFSGQLASPPFGRRGNPIERLADESTLAATSETVPKATLNAGSGQLFWFDPAGAIERTFAFDDHLRFGSRALRRSVGAQRLPGEERQRRQADRGFGTPSRVVAVGGDRARRAVAAQGDVRERRVDRADVLAAGRAPGDRRILEPRKTARSWRCSMPGRCAVSRRLRRTVNSTAPSCGPDRPLRYVVMPRSEVNRVSSAPFNRVLMSMRPGGLMVRTLELQGGGASRRPMPFTSSRRSWISSRRRTAIATGRRTASSSGSGKSRTRARTAPDRDGPRQIEVWEPATGWRMQSIHQATAPRGTTASRQRRGR